MKILFREIDTLLEDAGKNKNVLRVMLLTNKWLNLYNDLCKDKTITKEQYQKYYQKLILARDMIANVR